MAYDHAAGAPRDLERLTDLQYGVAPGEPDVRGWPVYASTGGTVGTVADLLVDRDAAEVVVLEIDLGGDGRYTLAPVRNAWIDGARGRVVLDAGALEALSSRPTSSDGFAFEASGVDAGVAERRVNRVDDASDLDDDAGIDPRELDARVRIEEGATVDDEAPVAGVRYEGEELTPHDYGTPAEAYGPEYGDGRIGFDHIVGPPADAPNADAPAAGVASTPTASGLRVVRYRRYPDAYAGPDAAR